MDSRREKCPRAAIVSLKLTFLALAFSCDFVLPGFIVAEGTPFGLSSEKAKVAWMDRRPHVFLDSTPRQWSNATDDATSIRFSFTGPSSLSFPEENR